MTAAFRDLLEQAVAGQIHGIAPGSTRRNLERALGAPTDQTSDGSIYKYGLLEAHFAAHDNLAFLYAESPSEETLSITLYPSASTLEPSADPSLQTCVIGHAKLYVEATGRISAFVLSAGARSV